MAKLLSGIKVLSSILTGPFCNSLHCCSVRCSKWTATCKSMLESASTFTSVIGVRVALMSPKCTTLTLIRASPFQWSLTLMTCWSMLNGLETTMCSAKMTEQQPAVNLWPWSRNGCICDFVAIESPWVFGPHVRLTGTGWPSTLKTPEGITSIAKSKDCTGLGLPLTLDLKNRCSFQTACSSPSWISMLLALQICCIAGYATECFLLIRALTSFDPNCSLHIWVAILRLSEASWPLEIINPVNLPFMLVSSFPNPSGLSFNLKATVLERTPLNHLVLKIRANSWMDRRGWPVIVSWYVIHCAGTCWCSGGLIGSESGSTLMFRNWIQASNASHPHHPWTPEPRCVKLSYPAGRSWFTILVNWWCSSRSSLLDTL